MSELDDFFAKKDRKKSKGKKFLGNDEKGKGKSDEGGKKSEKSAKKERIPREDGEEGSNPEQEVDEWREFEEEKKDYSGLKLGHLSISNNPSGEDGNTGGGEDGGSQDGGDCDDDGQDCGGEGAGNEVGGGSGKAQHHSGPWKRVNQQQSQQQPHQKPETNTNANGQLEKQQEEEPPKRTAGAYVPPSMRNQQLRGSQSSGGGGASGGRDLQPMRMRGVRAAAPDIHNEDYFPTLAAGAPGGTSGTGKDKQGAFEVVSHGRGNTAQTRVAASGGLRSSTSTTSGQQQQQLTLGNRFNTLSHNDS